MFIMGGVKKNALNIDMKKLGFALWN